MVGRKTQPHRDPAAEARDRFELKGADLQGHDVEVFALADFGGKGRADVPARDRFHAARVEHFFHELRSGRFSIRAGDADDRAGAHLIGELEFANHFDAPPDEVLHERHRGIDAGAENRKVVVPVHAFMIGGEPRDDADALRAEHVDFLAQFVFFGGV